MTKSKTDEWLIAEGEDVAVMQDRRVSGIRTVARLTATQVVLDDDSRYRRNPGRYDRVGWDTSSWAARPYLERLDNPRVVAARLRALAGQLARKVEELARTADLGETDDDRVAAIRAMHNVTKLGVMRTHPILKGEK